MPNAMMIAYTSPTSAQTEDEYNRWYNDKHLHDVASVEGVKAAYRYRIAQDIEPMPDVTGPKQGYLAIYELTAETEQDLEVFAGRLRDALASGQADISPALDMSDLGATLALPISELVRGISADPEG